ncbi:MAG: CoA transferase [Anaerolineaceae bacterium]|nr:CoA transferase [Anaerolineaceae bacterium]
MNQALENIRILDLTRVLAGPFATMVLADLGAEIIKVEIPGKGDDSRQFPPYIAGESAYFMSLNRNKRSITLNLKKEEGKKLFLKMIKNVDVVVENYRPGTMEKLGLGYETLRKVNPRLIYAAASGFGHTGPYSKRPAYDAVVQAMGGVMSITSATEGGPPTRVGTSMGDITAGLFTAVGILSALVYRQESGLGQKVDVAMLDSQVAVLENAIARYIASGTAPAPTGNRHPSIVPFEPFETSDGQIMIAVGNDVLWQKFCMAIDQPELAEDPRFTSNPLRNENYPALFSLISNIIKNKPTTVWQQILDDQGIPNGPINTIDKVLNDPQIKAREMIVEIEHPVAGIMKMPGVPIKMSETPGSVRFPAPVLGEHTESILKEIFLLDEQEITNLKENGVI